MTTAQLQTIRNHLYDVRHAILKRKAAHTEASTLLRIMEQLETEILYGELCAGESNTSNRTATE